MHHAERTEQIRQIIRASFSRFGADPETSLRETILVRDGLYCGRRFDCAQWQAVWFIEEDQIKFYGPQGALLQLSQPTSRPLAHTAVEHQKAA